MKWSRPIALALPMLALAMSGCAGKQAEVESVLAVRPVTSQCPAYPRPSLELLRRPATVFLPLTSISDTAPPPKPNNSDP